MNRPASVSRSRRLLICDNAHCDNGEVAALVELAMAGAEPSKRLELRPVANPGIRLRGRFTRCGPPRAAPCSS